MIPVTDGIYAPHPLSGFQPLARIARISCAKSDRVEFHNATSEERLFYSRNLKAHDRRLATLLESAGFSCYYGTDPIKILDIGSPNKSKIVDKRLRELSIFPSILQRKCKDNVELESTYCLTRSQSKFVQFTLGSGFVDINGLIAKYRILSKNLNGLHRASKRIGIAFVCASIEISYHNVNGIIMYNPHIHVLAEHENIDQNKFDKLIKIWRKKLYIHVDKLFGSKRIVNAVNYMNKAHSNAKSSLNYWQTQGAPIGLLSIPPNDLRFLADAYQKFRWHRKYDGMAIWAQQFQAQTGPAIVFKSRRNPSGDSARHVFVSVPAVPLQVQSPRAKIRILRAALKAARMDFPGLHPVSARLAAKNATKTATFDNAYSQPSAWPVLVPNPRRKKETLVVGLESKPSKARKATNGPSAKLKNLVLGLSGDALMVVNPDGNLSADSLFALPYNRRKMRTAERIIAAKNGGRQNATLLPSLVPRILDGNSRYRLEKTSTGQICYVCVVTEKLARARGR